MSVLRVKFASHRVEHEVEGGDCRFGGERERVERLVGDAGRAEDFGGKVEIRQRRLEDHRRAARRHRFAARFIRFDLPGDGDELLFAIANRPPGFFRAAGGVTSTG